MAAERTRKINMDEQPADFPAPEKLFTCGTRGVWSGKDFVGNIGCLGKVLFGSFDAHAQMCFACSRAMCGEFGVPRESSGPCACAVTSLHRYQGFMDGFSDVGRREGVRMLVIASGGVVLEPTEREAKGAAKVLAKFPAMREYWPESAHQNLAAAIGRMPEGPKAPVFEKRIPPQLEEMLSGESRAKLVGGAG